MSALAWLDAVQLEENISDSCVNASSRIHYHDCMEGELEIEVMVPLTRCTCASVHALGILDTVESFSNSRLCLGKLLC